MDAMMRILYITLENLSLHKGSVVHVKEIVNGPQRSLDTSVGLIAMLLEQVRKGGSFLQS